MGWARIDDGLDDHPKMLELLDKEEEGWAAISLWVLCLTWAHRNTRKAGKVPGLVPTSLPRRYLGGTGRGAAALLVQVGLWDDADGGWTIHDFGDYLPSDKTREARAAAGKKGAEARWRGKERSSGRADGHEPQPSRTMDGKEPSQRHAANGNEPSVSHEAAREPMASDGSRAHAHRGPTPVPEPESPTPPSPPHQRSSAEQRPVVGPEPGGGGRRTEDHPDGAGGRGGAQVIDMGIVADIQAVRPEWSARSIRRAWEHAEIQTRPADLVRAAFVLVARDPQTQHPGRLTHDGPWWSQAAQQTRPRAARPTWCGRCDTEASRMVELGDGRVARCPDCHPREARPA